MGNCLGAEEDPAQTNQKTPIVDPAERRRLQAAAAEKRLQESQSRGLSGADAAARVKKKQAAQAKAENSLPNDTAMQWKVG
eukprot:m.46767 g.46767  ORF g.46767 m.46767 type:complete len:81 (+) comp20331_c0_seq1:79-321(+)